MLHLTESTSKKWFTNRFMNDQGDDCTTGFSLDKLFQ